LGRIWQVNPATGEVKIAIEDPLLAPRPFVSLAPGANGLGFRGDALIATVSDRALVLRFPREGDSFGPAETLASGIPGDGFAVDKDGALFITTHPYDTVVRIGPVGQESTVATAVHHVAGASDAAFGPIPGGGVGLFVVTDGGAFAGNTDAEGSLVALDLD
jgi:sugar lactone lactonase YvrE